MAVNRKNNKGWIQYLASYPVHAGEKKWPGTQRYTCLVTRILPCCMKITASFSLIAGGISVLQRVEFYHSCALVFATTDEVWISERFKWQATFRQCNREKLTACWQYVSWVVSALHAPRSIACLTTVWIQHWVAAVEWSATAVVQRVAAVEPIPVSTVQPLTTPLQQLTTLLWLVSAISRPLSTYFSRSALLRPVLDSVLQQRALKGWGF